MQSGKHPFWNIEGGGGEKGKRKKHSKMSTKNDRG